MDPPPVAQTVTKTVTVSLEGREGPVNVRLLLDGTEVGSASADASLDLEVDVAVQGTVGMGVKELAIYINGVASGTARVDFDS